MNVDLRMHQLDLANALRAYVQRRLRFKLGRNAGRIRRLKLRLSEEEGTTGGAVKLCSLAAELVPSGEVIITETSIDLYMAVGRAIERLKARCDALSRGSAARNGDESPFETQSAEPDLVLTASGLGKARREASASRVWE
jgi:ribosome-associated translation inhibitor RaiA